MRKLLLTAAIAGAALTVAQEAQARYVNPGPRCVQTPTASGRTILVCGSPNVQRGVYNPVTCRKVYNARTRRMETLC